MIVGECPQQRQVVRGVFDLAFWRVGWLYSIEFSRMYMLCVNSIGIVDVV